MADHWWITVNDLKFQTAMAALADIAGEDYRGPRPHSVVVASQALERCKQIHDAQGGFDRGASVLEDTLDAVRGR